MPNEVEIKFRLADKRAVESQLRQLGFRNVTPETHEINALYDSPGNTLRRRSELLRLRKYSDQWTLTHKSKGSTGLHKSREEHETGVADGGAMAAILQALGYVPRFRYEKFRGEWSDGTGHVVLDRTPIGDYGEIEGPPGWIDRIALQLGVLPGDYITSSYAELFEQWKQRSGCDALHMTFEDCGRWMSSKKV